MSWLDWLSVETVRAIAGEARGTQDTTPIAVHTELYHKDNGWQDIVLERPMGELTTTLDLLCDYNRILKKVIETEEMPEWKRRSCNDMAELLDRVTGEWPEQLVDAPPCVEENERTLKYLSDVLHDQAHLLRQGAEHLILEAAARADFLYLADFCQRADQQLGLELDYDREAINKRNARRRSNNVGVDGMSHLAMKKKPRQDEPAPEEDPQAEQAEEPGMGGMGQ